MSNLYTIKAQHTHHGKTAAEYLKGAHVATAPAGNSGVVSPALPGCWLILTETNDMVIDGLDHGPVRLLCSIDAVDTLLPAAERRTGYVFQRRTTTPGRASLRPCTTPSKRARPRWTGSTDRASEKPGAVQFEANSETGRIFSGPPKGRKTLLGGPLER